MKVWSTDVLILDDEDFKLGAEMGTLAGFRGDKQLLYLSRIILWRDRVLKSTYHEIEPEDQGAL
jgi:hypothetical protein